MSYDLATLIGSRICHDLISPIGAIGNGVELLQLTDGDTSAEVQLISDSVASANARIRFFRIAFGASADGQMVNRSEILGILTASAIGGRFTYFWQLDDDMSRHDVRLIFLLFQCLETAMPLGGEVTIDDTSGQIKLTATGRKINAPPSLWSRLETSNDDLSDLTAAQVHFALLNIATQAAGRTVEYVAEDTQITITL